MNIMSKFRLYNQGSQIIVGRISEGPLYYHSMQERGIFSTHQMVWLR